MKILRGVTALHLLLAPCYVVVPSTAFTSTATSTTRRTTTRRSRCHGDDTTCTTEKNDQDNNTVVVGNHHHWQPLPQTQQEHDLESSPSPPPRPPPPFATARCAASISTKNAAVLDQPTTTTTTTTTITTTIANSRRQVLANAAWCLSSIPAIAFAMDDDGGNVKSDIVPPPPYPPPPVLPSRPSTATAVVTDLIYVDIASPTSSPTSATPPDRLVIGLFGQAAPASVAKVRQLVSPNGLAAPCRPRAQRTLQKEQLESNVLYYRCMDGENEGVSLQYSTIWRIRKDFSIDIGAVTGKFVAREYPTYTEDNEEKEVALDDDSSSAASASSAAAATTVYTAYSHDAAGLVSVRRGNESGFGFTISPVANPTLDEDYIVIGRVMDDGASMDVVAKLNEIPVVNSAPVVNYMALTGGPKTTNAPDRSCRYGGPMYCNENKPLVKLKIVDCGVLKL